MLKLLFGVVYLVCRVWGAHRRVEYVGDLVGLDDDSFFHLLGGSR